MPDVISSRQFRIAALAEAVSFLALLVATYFKHSAGNPAGVSVLGPIHGTLFLLYVAGALLIRSRMGWSLLNTVAVLAGAVLPFGGFVVDRWIAQQAQVSGDERA